MGCRSIREGVWHTFIAGLRVVERTKRKSVWRPCQAVCLYICLWSNISCSKSCWIFMKSGVVESAVSFFGFFFVKSDVVEWGVSFFGFLWNPVLSNKAPVSLVFCEIRCCRIRRQFLWFFVKSSVVESGVSFFGFLWNPVLSNGASVSLVFCEIRCCRMRRQFLELRRSHLL